MKTRVWFIFLWFWKPALFVCFSAFAPMNYGGDGFVRDDVPSRDQPLDAQRYFSEGDDSEWEGLGFIME